MHLGIKNFVGWVKKYLFGDGTYSQNIVQDSATNIAAQATLNAVGTYQGGYEAAKAVDNNTGTAASATSSASNALGFYFATARNVRQVSIYQLAALSYGCAAKWQYSDNGTTWTDTNQTAINCPYTGSNYTSDFTINDYGWHCYWRLITTNGAIPFQVGELYIYERVVLQPTTYSRADLMPTMASASQGGFTVSATGTQGGCYPWCAFDGVVGTFVAGSCWNYNASTATFQIACPSPAPTKGYTIQAPSDVTTYQRMISAWQFQGSNDGSSWVTLDTQSVGTTWANSEVKAFTLAGGVASYPYYRLNITAGSGGWVGIGEMQLVPPDIPNAIVITGAATVAPDAETGAAAFSAMNIVGDGPSASLTASTNCKGLIGFVAGSVTLLNGAIMHMDKLGKAGNFGNLTAYDLAPTAIKKKLKKSFYDNYVVLGEGAAGGAGQATTGATINGLPGSAASALQTGGGGGGAPRSGGGTSTSGSGGNGGPCCGGAGGGSICSIASNSASSASPYGGPAGAAVNDGYAYPVGGSAGDPVGAPASAGTAASGPGGGLLMVFSPSVSIASGCVISAGGGNGGNGYASGAAAGGGCVAIVTSPGGYTNAGTVRANGGVYGTTTYDANSKGGTGGAGSVNIFQNAA